ncbi:MAG: methyltransferase domain-containing protein [Verrucomicrobiota bacterium]
METTAITPSTPPGAAHRAELAARREALRGELASILPTGGRFVWEIGCGHGHFLTAYAAAHRDELCVGVDQELDRINRARRKQHRAGLPNLHFVRAEARLFLAALPPGAKLAAVFVLFPDPWPKRRHHKHRLLQKNFLQDMADLAGPGTPFYFRTDHGPYFEEVEAMLRTHAAWRLIPGEPWPFERPTVFQQRAPGHFSLVARRQ